MHRGRFAPSPTGRMHLGNAWAALLGWLWARSEGGEFLLRIEDLDVARCRPEHVDALRSDLLWLGLDFDPPEVRQSEQRAAHDAALGQLHAQGHLYPCFCTRSEIARAATAPHGPADEGPVYPGTCAALGTDDRPARPAARPFALRFRPEPGLTRFADLLHGEVVQDVLGTVGDFVVRRTDGVASYQLAVVVDDARGGITHVLRGDDLLGSTPRQIQVARALGLPVPSYAHVPLLLGPDGGRLAKRAEVESLGALRAQGVRPERLIGLLAGWAGLTDGSPSTARALVPGFALERIRRTPVEVTAHLRF